MKLLLDSCVFGRARPEIEAGGHDVIWAGDWREDPRSPRDVLILESSVSEA